MSWDELGNLRGQLGRESMCGIAVDLCAFAWGPHNVAILHAWTNHQYGPDLTDSPDRICLPGGGALTHRGEDHRPGIEFRDSGWGAIQPDVLAMNFLPAVFLQDTWGKS